MMQFLQQYWLPLVFFGAMLAMHLGGHRHGGAGMHGGCGGHGAHRTDEHVDRHRHAGADPAAPAGHNGTPQDAMGVSAAATPQDDTLGRRSATRGQIDDAAGVGPRTAD